MVSLGVGTYLLPLGSNKGNSSVLCVLGVKRERESVKYRELLMESKEVNAQDVRSRGIAGYK